MTAPDIASSILVAASVGSFLGVVGTAIAVAWVSYDWVESRFKRISERLDWCEREDDLLRERIGCVERCEQCKHYARSTT